MAFEINWETAQDWANNFNLDLKNPQQQAAEQADLDELLTAHANLVAEVQEVRSKLKFELMASLGGNPNGLQ